MKKIDEILKIKELLNSGVINENEFIELKNKLLEDSNSKNAVAQIKVEIGADEKECPNCNVILSIDNEECDFCDYVFPNKTNKHQEQEITSDIDKIKTNINSNNKKSKASLVTGILILSLLALGFYLFKSNGKDNIATETKSVSIDTVNNLNKISNIQFLMNEKIRFDDLIDSNELSTETVSNYIDDLNSLKFDGSESDYKVYYDSKSHINLIVEEPRLSMNGSDKGEEHKYYFNSKNEIFAQESGFYSSDYNDETEEIIKNSTTLTNYYFENRLVKSDTVYDNKNKKNISFGNYKHYKNLNDYNKINRLKLSLKSN